MAATKKHHKKRVIGIVLGLVVIAMIAAGSYFGVKSLAIDNSGKLKVVAAENFWGNIAAQIGGNRVSVTSIINDPSADPHLYESDARDAANIGAADIVLKNGLGYDDFMDKLLSASSGHIRQVITAAQVAGAGDKANPHLWYSLDYVRAVAAATESAMAAKDPSDATLFERNLANFDESLQPVAAATQQIKSKHATAPVAYTERVPEYLLEAAGLQIKTPPGFASAIEEGNDPSPADARAMQNLITGHRIKALIYNEQATSQITSQLRGLATKNHVPVVGVTETMPANARNYQTWQLNQAKALLKALGN